jgi:hypothetical protein
LEINDINKSLKSILSSMSSSVYLKNTQNELLLENLMEFYNDRENLNKMIRIINGESKISLRIVDWFVTNYAKKNYVTYDLTTKRGILTDTIVTSRFKVYNDYKLKLKAYSKKRFDPFCRWDRISIPYDDEKYMETTIGQLNFFKWAIENKIVEYIEDHYGDIESDMNNRNSSSRKKEIENDNKTRKKREELSISACKSVKKEMVSIIVRFNE